MIQLLGLSIAAMLRQPHVLASHLVGELDTLVGDLHGGRRLAFIALLVAAFIPLIAGILQIIFLQGHAVLGPYVLHTNIRRQELRNLPSLDLGVEARSCLVHRDGLLTTLNEARQALSSGWSGGHLEIDRHVDGHAHTVRVKVVSDPVLDCPTVQPAPNVQRRGRALAPCPLEC